MASLRRNFGRDDSGDDESLPRLEVDPSASFRARVDAFWDWFAANEVRLYEDLHAKSLDVDTLVAALAALAPIEAWEFCPSPEAGREGFALSAEGNTSKRLLVDYALRRAPNLERWTLFPAKQAQDDIAGSSIDIGTGERFEFDEFRFSVDFDTDSEQLAITVNHPKFPSLPKDARLQLTFLALDNALGEDLVESWVGAIEDTPERTPEQKHGIAALRRKAHAALSLHDLDPEQGPVVWGTYEIDDTGDGDAEPRADVFVGTTCNIELVRSSRDPEAEDELAGSGACFAYVMFPVSALTQGNELEQRNEVLDALKSHLFEPGLGDIVGGGMGHQYAYIDLILFDERPAIEVAREVLASFAFVATPKLLFFAKDRADESVPLG